ncbi:MAG TPA: LysM domain-containing protein [Burkholderiales bacterium]|nr:LysM domain-containing protein [Burkholderiales bacterium]
MVQQFCKSITTLVFFLVCGLAWGQAPSAPLALKADAPDRYVIVPGDTLWGISTRYTDSPWRWPELWSMNREQIQNPHLIYPGMVLLLDRARGTLSIEGAPSTGPRISGGTGEAGRAGAGVPAGSALKLSPRVRAESLAKQAIPSIPPSAIEPFLSRPLVIEPDGLEKAPTIVATEKDRVILSAGNSAYVRGITDATEATWYVYRRGDPLVDPDTNRTLGYEAIYLGTAQVTRPGDPATVQLTSTVQEVNAGDKLVAAGRAETLSYAPRAPSVQLSGRVMKIYGTVGRVGEAGPLQIVSINRGRADGVEIGHVLALYSLGGTVRDTTKARNARDALIKLPDERAGLSFVFRVFDRVSYALVMHVTTPVSPLDVVRTP